MNWTLLHVACILKRMIKGRIKERIKERIKWIFLQASHPWIDGTNLQIAIPLKGRIKASQLRGSVILGNHPSLT